MIRALAPSDLDAVMQIWLSGNEQAHPFVPASYWRGVADAVRRELPHAEVLVHEGADGEPDGFIGLTGSYVAGLFVSRDARSRGIGSALLAEAKRRHRPLSLHVYRDNERAAAFYLREGFVVVDEGTDASTGAAEYEMAWGEERGA